MANALQQNKVTYVTKSLILVFTHYLTQALTSLNVTFNRLGSQGAAHFGNGLQQNEVTCSRALHLITHFLFRTDTHFTEPGIQ